MKKLTTFLATVTLVSVHCAPSSKSSSPHTQVNQKQTGDYNIQLHLKDFQIIALLSGDTGLGDYDYNYDYDFTFKPSTSKPSQSTTPSSSHPSSTFPTPVPSSTKPPYPTHKPGTDVTKPSTNYPTPPPTTSKPSSSPLKPVENPEKPNSSKPESSSITPEPSTIKPEPSTPKAVPEAPNKVAEEKPDENQIKDKEAIPSSTVSIQNLDDIISPGKIKVQIIEAPMGSLGPVPGEELNVGQINDANVIAQNSGVIHTRKCGSGFTRDAKGRCRRVRKPGASSSLFGFSRLANNLASRFVKDASHSASMESEESK